MELFVIRDDDFGIVQFSITTSGALNTKPVTFTFGLSADCQRRDYQNALVGFADHVLSPDELHWGFAKLKSAVSKDCGASFLYCPLDKSGLKWKQEIRHPDRFETVN